MTSPYDDIRCPACNGELGGDIAVPKCKGCDREFKKQGDILDLRLGRNDYYFNPIPREDMAKIRAAANRDTWAENIRYFLEKTGQNKSWIDNLVVNGRYAWKLFLGAQKDAKILDLGCGLGNLTHNIAPHVGTVYAMDLTMERLEFSERRFSIFNADDRIKLIAGGDGPRLPFPDNHLDGVILSGVLEWMGEGDTSSFETGSKPQRLMNMLRAHFGKTNPRQIQLGVLKEIQRVLKPEGQLFIGIENRLNWEYLGKRRDHHSGLWFGSLMPRFLATLYSIVATKKPYRTFTYSIPGYRSLLQQAGFPQAEFLGLDKGYSDLREILPSEINFDAWKPQSSAGKKGKMGRKKYFVPAYGVIASQQGTKPDSLLSTILQEAAKAVGGALTFSDFQITGKDKGVLSARQNDQEFIIKVPFSEAALKAEQRNAENLKAIEALFDGETSPAPTAIAQGLVQAQSYFIETKLPGTAIETRLASIGRAGVLTDVEKFQTRLNPSPVVTTITDDLFQRLVTQRLEVLFQIVDDPEVRSGLTKYFTDSLKDVNVATGIAQGDFSVSNIFHQNDAVRGAIDWEAGDTTGLPVLDMINFVESTHRMFNSEATLADTIPMLVSGQSLTSEETEFLDRGFTRNGVVTDDRAVFVHLYWLHHIAQQVPYMLQFDTVQIGRVVTPVITSILKR